MTHSATLEKCLAYVECQTGPNRPKSPAQPPLATAVTLSRQAGTGGTAIAGQLAAFLQHHRPASPAPWTVFDRSLLERVLAEHNLPSNFARYMPEDRVSYIRDTIEELLGLHPSRTDLVTRTCQTILGLAELGGCILVGRAAHVILADSPTTVHVRLVGSTARRIARCMQDLDLSEDRAARHVQEQDAGRARYLKSHFNADPEDPLAYDLTLNTDRLSDIEAARIIGHIILERGVTSPPPAPQTPPDAAGTATNERSAA